MSRLLPINSNDKALQDGVHGPVNVHFADIVVFRCHSENKKRAYNLCSILK